MWKIWNYVAHTELTDKTESMAKNIEKILFNLYGFNLWFAVEKSMDDIRDRITDSLTKENWMPEWNMHAVAWIMTDEKIQVTIDKYSEYKKWVEQRAKYTDSI